MAESLGLKRVRTASTATERSVERDAAAGALKELARSTTSFTAVATAEASAVASLALLNMPEPMLAVARRIWTAGFTVPVGS